MSILVCRFACCAVLAVACWLLIAVCFKTSAIAWTVLITATLNATWYIIDSEKL